MPLTQETRLDNNNDHNYRHKKFKKMASTIAVFPNTFKGGDSRHKDIDSEQTTYNTSISNGSIAAAHPEIEKIKETTKLFDYLAKEKNVQINFNGENIRVSDVNDINPVSGHTSFTNEFSNKTENLENDFIRDAHIGGTIGRNVCPYCKLSCAKPSVLQKHIRAHTNERPYPCEPCGFAFKTKSNLYKHRRSRTHVLRLQGAEVPTTINEEESGSESDSSLPSTSVDNSSDISVYNRNDNATNSDFSPPDISNDRITPPTFGHSLQLESNKSKTIYKPKFRAKFFQEVDEKDKTKKTISTNADFLTEHISKIISDNEAIVDVIESPLQKKYSKIKQIAERKHILVDSNDIKSESIPLNLTKSHNDSESSFRKRSHSESFTSIDNQKHPLNPEGSIIKDLLLKNQVNGLNSLPHEIIDGLGPVYTCPLCPIMYRSAENLEAHRLHYCKGSTNSSSPVMNASQKTTRSENIFMRSNSVNVRLPESPSNSFSKLHSSKSPPLRSKPDNIIIIKQETNDVIAPLPSPGPLLGNTRLVDSRVPPDYRISDSIKMKSASPKRKLERSDTYSPKLLENVSPRSTDLYSQTKIRCIENNTTKLRTLDEISKHMRHNSTSLQMFGGEVKIVDHSGSTTTLRIEPSKNQLSPILIQQNLSPSKIGNESEASSVVVRSGLHSGGTMVHNPPTPKEIIITPQPQTPRISISNVTGISNSNMPNIHDITHFQFPPLSAITAFNPLTLPPLSPTSPNAPSTILHGGKLIPHVPGMPGPNTPGVFMGNKSVSPINILCGDNNKKTTDTQHESSYGTYMSKTKGINVAKYEQRQEVGKNLRTLQGEPDKLNKAYNVEMPQYTLPVIKIRNVDEPNVVSRLSPVNKPQITRLDGGNKRQGDGIPRMSIIKEGTNFFQFRNKSSEKISNSIPIRNIDTKTDNEIKSYNFENFITKAEIYSKQIQTSTELQKNKNGTPTTLVQNERSETSYFQKNNAAKNGPEERKPKFLRPSSLPLKPGTFTPKKHHGITPNANTMPLVSPETPRPAKAYGQLYLNGNAYTYLGLKCSTKVSYCTINRPQPTYVPNQHFLSMYSNWQLLSELTPDPLGLTASTAMSLYDSRHRPQNIVAAVIKQDLILTHSSQWNQNSKDNKQALHILDSNNSEEGRYQGTDSTVITKKELAGGFESNEEYTYVRGRGRGRYVCSECGIRCKKPSMLKKHIRTHTDVRPYTCTHCAFSFKTKGNLTKHMKSKAHYKKCNELGINPNEGQDLEGGETAQCSGETDDDTESEVDEGIEGETESSDTEICKSRLPEHEAARCLLSLGGTRQATSTTPGLITSARPSTYPYTPDGLESMSCDQNTETLQIMDALPVDSSMEVDSEPMDLSKNEIKTSTPEIPTARESSVLASLASNTAKLPQHQTHWSNGEPMLHTYLTERALLDSKIKQSQLTSNLSRLRKVELDNSITEEKNVVSENNKITSVAAVKTADTVLNAPSTASSTVRANETDFFLQDLPRSKEEVSVKVIDPVQVTHSSTIHESKRNHTSSSGNAENAKYVVSEYLKHARINLIKTYDASTPSESSADVSNNSNISGEENRNGDDINVTDTDSPKLTNLDHDPVAPKVVIGAGGVAFKVSKGKEYDGTPPYSPGRLMEDGRRVCDFCNKTFTKPSQLRLHLNIHYMERPFRCSACAVSFRTRGHLQKHERSGSHHNKVSMTSTFGAATSLNPRPFGCSDCNIAFRIHGHLAKHLRSKMHVMRLECLFKLPFGTFTEIERAGVSLTDIDTTDCASSLTSLQSLARKLHEKDPTKLEYREPNGASTQAAHLARDSSEDEDITNNPEKAFDCVKDSDMKTIDNSEDKETD